MSNPTQNVYFYSPDSVSYVNSGISNAQNQIGYGQTLTSAGQTGVNNILQNYAYGVQTGPFFGQGVNDMALKCGMIECGNVKTGQSFTYSTGVIDSSNTPANADTSLIYPYSVGKIMAGLVCAKLIEEGIITPSTTLGELDPAVFTGAGQYFSSVTVLTGAAFPGPGSYTATTGSFDLSTFTINDCLHMNIGALQSAFAIPVATVLYTPTYSTGSSSLLGNLGSNATTADKALLIQSFTLFYLQNLGIPLGWDAKAAAGTTITPSDIKQTIVDYFSAFRSGLLPLAYIPNSKSYPILPYALRDIQNTYSFSYSVLGYALDQAIRLRTSYTNFAAYIRAKIFVPLNMNNTYMLYQEAIPLTNLSDQPWRKNLFLGACYFNGTTLAPEAYNFLDPTTWPRLYTSTGYSNACYSSALTFVGSTGALETIAGPYVWSTDPTYADDANSRLYRATFYTGAADPNATIDGTAGIITTITDMAKLIKMLANQGVAPNGTRIFKTQTWQWILSPKISASNNAQGNVLTTFASGGSYNNYTYCSGNIRKVNNDLTNATTYGIDEDSFTGNGRATMTWYFDLYTGNYFVRSVNENGYSTSTFPLPSSIVSQIAAGLQALNPDIYTIRSSQISKDVSADYYDAGFIQNMIKN
jgi:CubicO group peptidase (beta-lactamase class C family)